MDIKASYLGMIKAMEGGWGAMTGALALTRDALENRIYERKGQGIQVETALMMQKFSGSTLFAQAVATESGGTFVKLPPDMDVGNEEIEKKWRALYRELGEFAHHFEEAIADGEIDKREKRILKDDAACMHRIIEEMIALSLKVYTKSAKSEHK